MNTFLRLVVIGGLITVLTNVQTQAQVKQGDRVASPEIKTAAREQFVPTRKVVYKTIGDVQLKLHVFEPPKSDDVKRPAIVFFFGGGWNGGTPNQFYPHCAHLAEYGVVAISAEYRIKNKHKTTPFECVKDGKSAIRWVRAHADELGVDPNRIAAGGGSAGGHVAATTGTVPGLDEEGEDTSVSSRPNALILFNPVYDNGPGGYGYNRVRARYQEISPIHNIGRHTPPTIVFLGTKDNLIPVKTAESFRDQMNALGIKSELKLYDGATHGFFNLGKGDGSAYRQTITEMDEFLRSVGFIPASSAN
jgi:acetyl esterase